MGVDYIMLKRVSTVALSVIGVAVSVFLFFKEPLEYLAGNKYEGGGTENTYDNIISDFIQDISWSPTLMVIFAVTVLVLILYAVLAHVNNAGQRLTTVAKIASFAAYAMTAVATFTVEMPGEGFEMLAAIPFFLGTAPVVTILFIVSMVKKSKAASLTTIGIAGAINVFYTNLICWLCDEIAIGCTIVLSVVSVIITFVWCGGEAQAKSRWWAVPVSVFCVLLMGVMTFGDMYLYYDRTTRMAWEKRGYTYVGSNDGKEKERAHFSIDGFEGYYAYETKQSACIPYKDGDICLVESYDFSSENIVVPATLNGKKVMLRERHVSVSDSNVFFKHLAENRDKFKTITIADGLGYTVKDNTVYDAENQRIIYLCFGNKKSVTIDSSISCIDEYAFAYSGVEAVTFEDGVGQMRGGAFADCPIKELTMPDGMCTIGSDNSVLGTASKLQTVNLGKECNIWTPLGDFDEDVRSKNENDNVTLTVNTKTVTDLYDLGEMIYNYPKVEINLNMSKKDYIDAGTSYGISDKMMDKLKDDGDTITFTESLHASGVKTEVTINFA